MRAISTIILLKYSPPLSNPLFQNHHQCEFADVLMHSRVHSGVQLTFTQRPWRLSAVVYSQSSSSKIQLTSCKRLGDHRSIKEAHQKFKMKRDEWSRMNDIIPKHALLGVPVGVCSFVSFRTLCVTLPSLCESDCVLNVVFTGRRVRDSTQRGRREEEKEENSFQWT